MKKWVVNVKIFGSDFCDSYVFATKAEAVHFYNNTDYAESPYCAKIDIDNLWLYIVMS